MTSHKIIILALVKLADDVLLYKIIDSPTDVENLQCNMDSLTK